MQWLGDNWYLVLTSLVAAYGAVVATMIGIRSERRAKRAEESARAAQEEDVTILRVFATYARDRDRELRVELVNNGQRAVPIKDVKVHGGTELPMSLFLEKGYPRTLTQGYRAIWGRELSNLHKLARTAPESMAVVVWSNIGVVARAEGERVASVLKLAQ